MAIGKLKITPNGFAIFTALVLLAALGHSIAGAEPPRSRIAPVQADGPRIQPGMHRHALDANDVRYPSGEHYDEFFLDAKAGQVLTLAMKSPAVDAFLQLRSPEGELVVNDDANDTTHDAEIRAVLPETGTYVIECTTAGANEVGEYSLAVQLAGNGWSEPPSRTPTRIAPGSFTSDLTTRSPIRFGEYPVALFSFDAPAGTYARLRLRSAAFDPLMIVKTPSGQRFTTDDGTPESNAAGVEFEVMDAGTFTVYASAANTGGYGEFTLDFAVDGPAPAVTALVPDTPVTVDFSESTAPRQFSIAVPAGAKSLELTVATADAMADVDVAVRARHAFYGWSVAGDWKSAGPLGHEAIFLDGDRLTPGHTLFVLVIPASGQPLRTTATLTARFDSPRPGTFAHEVITPGEPREYRLPMAGYYFRIFAVDVPENSEVLWVVTDTQAVMAMVKFGEPTLSPQFADRVGIGQGRAPLMLVIRGEELRAGRYFITLQARQMRAGDLRVGVDSAMPLPAGVGEIEAGKTVELKPRNVASDGMIQPTIEFAVNVPADAKSMSIAVETDSAAVAHMAVAANRFVPVMGGEADHEVFAAKKSALLWVDAASSPPLRAGLYFVRVSPGIVDDSRRPTFRVTVIFDGANPGEAAPLALDRAMTVTLPQHGRDEFDAVIEVPESARSLEILAEVTGAAMNRAFVLVRAGEPIADLREADFTSFGTDSHRIVIDSPALKAGKYYIRVGALAPVEVRLIAKTFDVPAVVRGADAMLMPQIPAQLRFPRAAVSEQSFALAFEVPAHTKSVLIAISGAEQDYDLFASYGEFADFARADYSASTMAHNEFLWIGPDARPALRPGFYGLKVRTFGEKQNAITITLSFDVEAPDESPDEGGANTPARPAIDPATVPVLLPKSPTSIAFPRPGETHDRVQFRFDVPADATSMLLAISESPADCDLFVRRGVPVDAISGADYEAISPAANEKLWVSRGSVPTLEADTYFVQVRYFGNEPASVTLILEFDVPEPATAEPFTPPAVDGESLPELLPGEPVEVTFAAETGLMTRQFRFRVPEGTKSVLVRVEGARVDIDLYVRLGEPLRTTADAAHRADTLAFDEVLWFAGADGSPVAAGTGFLLLANYAGEAATVRVRLQFDAPDPAGAAGD